MGSFTSGNRDCSLQKLSPANLLESLPLKASFVIVFDFFSGFLNNYHNIPLLC